MKTVLRSARCIGLLLFGTLVAALMLPWFIKGMVKQAWRMAE